MEKKPIVTSCIGIDGYNRTIEYEDELNHLFAKVFSDDAGPKVIEYLRMITVNAVVPATASPELLRHQEGMRDLFRIIQQRINQGREGPNVRRKQPVRNGIKYNGATKH